MELACFGKRVFVVLLTMGWILEWNSGLIHCVSDPLFSWVVYPSELAFHRVQDYLIWTSELRVMAVSSRYISAENIPADGPLKGGGRSTIISDELEQNRF